MDTDDDFIPNLIDQHTLNFLNQGYDFIKLGKYNEAKMCFQNATNSNKKSIDAWLNFGITKSILNEDDVIQVFEKSLKIGVGKRGFTNHRFNILCDNHYKNNPKVSQFKHDFELAKSHIDEGTVKYTIITFVTIIIKKYIYQTGSHEKQPPPGSFFPSDLLEDYPEHKFHSEGGNSRVYKCKRKNDGLIVAIKIPKEFDRKKSKDFIDEIAIWKELNHKNIVKIFDYSTIPPHIVMEYFPRSLNQLEKPMPTTEAVKMIMKLLDALSYAHKKGRIHADIKPANILLSNNDDPKLADWGLGRISGLSQSEGTSQAAYTPAYAAPEQLRYETPDVQTDIWQIGVVFYELITGINPFEGDDPECTYNKIMSEEPVVLPSTHMPNVQWLDSILLKSLQKKKDKRYRSVDELAHDIDEARIKDLTTKTKDQSHDYVKLNSHFELIRIYCQKNNYDEVISHLREILNLSHIDQIRMMIDTQIEAAKAYQSLGKDLNDHFSEDLEKMFKKYQETHVIETH